ncbi:MAG: endonuclease/exonuclease/phosphatase family protein [Akkermansiaceae bacterium]|nr:endonuclease/exonuclease/phosphatase family protein [Akkermansiaceae bacterium]
MTRLLAFLLLLLAGPVAVGDALTIVTYNIRNDNAGDQGGRDWQQRKAALTAYLRGTGAGIIGLQEVKHNQLQDVEKDLPGHAYVGVGRDDGKTRGEYSPIFYDKKTWKPDPAQGGTFWLSDTPEVPKSMTWGNRYPRICTWARLIGIAKPVQGKAIYVYNTHWDHQSQPSRVKSAELMLETVKSRTHKKDPVILMGDFNATTDNPAIKSLLDSGLVVDHGKKQTSTSSRWKEDLVPGLRIDHVFTSPGIREAVLTVESAPGAEGHAASDHHPVVLRIAAFP